MWASFSIEKADAKILLLVAFFPSTHSGWKFPKNVSFYNITSEASLKTCFVYKMGRVLVKVSCWIGQLWQNKNKKARKFKYLLSSSQILFKNETFLSDFQTFQSRKKSDKLYISAIATSCNIKLIAMGIFPIPPSPKKNCLPRTSLWTVMAKLANIRRTQWCRRIILKCKTKIFKKIKKKKIYQSVGTASSHD